MTRQLVLATGNVDKRDELRALLGEAEIDLLTLADFPDLPEVVEDGATCEANAIKKATAVAKWTGRWAMADDTGLEVEALNGRPGVYAARYAGAHATYEDNWQKLLEELQGVPGPRRTARFLTAIALADPSGAVDVVEGVLEGRIAEEPRGAQGFGYDPVFEVPDLGYTLAELSREEKNRISHRARAFAKAKARLLSKLESLEESGRSAAR